MGKTLVAVTDTSPLIIYANFRLLYARWIAQTRMLFISFAMKIKKKKELKLMKLNGQERRKERENLNRDLITRVNYEIQQQ